MPKSRQVHDVAMVISSLSGGGAERVLALLAQGLVERGYRVSVVTVFGRQRDFYELPQEVRRIALGLGRDKSNLVEKLAGNLRRVRALRDAFGELRPDVAVSFMSQTNVLALLAARRLNVPVVVTEHFDSRRQPLRGVWGVLRRLTYHRAARVVSVSQGVDAYFNWLPAERRAVIPNPVRIDAAAAGPPAAAGGRPHFVMGMGRLEEEKGFDLLIRAFARITADFPDWGLVILGEGSRRDQLERLIEEHGLDDRVELPGGLAEPFGILRAADLFVMPSRHEGFGNALVEAMACGVPVVAADCWSQSPGLVCDGTNGLVVPCDDVTALAGAMAELMADDRRRSRLAEQAAGSVERFSLARVIAQWEDLLAAAAMVQCRRGF